MKKPTSPFLFLATALIIEVTAPIANAAAPAKLSAVSRRSDAAESPSAQAEQASQRFQRGVSLYRERSFDAALAEFNRAYELAPNYRVLFNIGQVHVERGDFVAGIKAFRQYLNEGGTAIEPARVTEVQTEITRLEGRLATITVTSNVAGAELFVDGEFVGSLPRAHVPVNAGMRRISLRKEGYEADEMRVMLATGEEKVLDIKLQNRTSQEAAGLRANSLSTGPHHQATAVHKASGGLGAGFWVSLSATMIAGGATATFGLLTSKADSDYDAALNHYPGSQSLIDDARRDVKRNALLTDVCGAATLVGVASTLFFAISSSPEKPKQSSFASPGLSWGPVIEGHKGLLWHMSGRF
ncbi:MAG TPA: PEGA domain-containing protein [Polyangiaceae bacterium]|nr:PEGA domain-containing protein [Polyangiaceae bacterium]